MKHLKAGMTLVELLIYIGILLMLTGVVVATLLALSRSYNTLKSTENIDSAAEIAMERMVRFIRNSASVDTGLSTLGTSPGVLQLNTLDESEHASTAKFSLTGQVLHITEAGVDEGPLTSSNVRITSLIFTKITTAQSQAVKIQMQLESGTSTSYRVKSFYSTVVLRGSYPVQ
jgi:type II secretory pathway pseudopilin PulG